MCLVSAGSDSTHRSDQCWKSRSCSKNLQPQLSTWLGTNPILILSPIRCRRLTPFLMTSTLRRSGSGLLAGRNVLMPMSCSSTMSGPYEGLVGRTWEYRLTKDEAVVAPEIYREQVEAIEAAFSDAAVQCYQEERWDVEW